MADKAPEHLAELSAQPLDLARYVAWVADPGAGAIATFSGVTRDSFEGRRVVRLEYEAYEAMALAKLKEICVEGAGRWRLRRVALAHRTGVVPVGEASVLIAVSSVHRKDALEACHWAIDALKATVPIWKKEVYEDGSTWKENTESRLMERCGAA